MVYKDGPSQTVLVESPMKVFRHLRVGRYVLVVSVIAMTLAVDVLAKEMSITTRAKAPVSYARPWVMVGLSPDGCSRGCRHVFSVVKELSGNPNGLIVHFSKVTPEWLAELQPSFIILSPQGTPWCRYTGEMGVSLQNFLWMLPMAAEEMNIPVIGICGGHQALALAFGGKVGPIRGGEDDCLPYGKNPTERGRHNVYVVADDPLFQGMGKTVNLVQNHYDEVKRLPEGFVRLAQNELCGYQIIKHPTKPAYGVQAHTEYYLKTRPDGGVLLKNFLGIAKTHNELVRKSPRGEKRRTAGRENEQIGPESSPR